MIYRTKVLAVCFFSFILSSCTLGIEPSHAKNASEKQAVQDHAKNITIKALTFNVENLFDSVDDDRRKDETYLPKELKRSENHKGKCKKIHNKKWKHACLHWDWDEDFLKQKLGRISEVIRSAFQEVPDIVFLQEVENKRVLDALVNDHLADLNYTAELIEGKDPRGIDVAILHRGTSTGKAFQHQFEISRGKGKRSNHVRPFLVSTFKLHGKKVAAISAHLPSPRNPSIQREEGILALNALGKKLEKKYDLIVAGGDFNINSAEDSRLYRGLAGEHWLVSHHEDCKRCIGTNYYKRKKSWSFLDAILIHKHSKATFKKESTRIVNDLWFQQTSAGRPARMYLRGNKLDGVSDHFAIATEISID